MHCCKSNDSYKNKSEKSVIEFLFAHVSTGFDYLFLHTFFECIYFLCPFNVKFKKRQKRTPIKDKQKMLFK